MGTGGGVTLPPWFRSGGSGTPLPSLTRKCGDFGRHIGPHVETSA